MTMIYVRREDNYRIQDPLSRGISWAREVHGGDDWTEELPPPVLTKEELEKRNAVAKKKAAIRELELKNLRKLYDGEDITAVNAERAKLRGEINELEGV